MIDPAHHQSSREKRRKLPAPPLVLTPYLVRMADNHRLASALLEFAGFLERRGALTDGGRKNLALELHGRNGSVSLSAQDVRSWAHAFVVEVFPRDAFEPALWAQNLESYQARFDKGKRRRPTHLQRLYLEWSRDQSWPGLLEVLPKHPHLWAELSLALERLSEPSLDRFLLEVAVACRREVSLNPWEEAFSQSGDEGQEALFQLYFYLSPARKRVPRLSRLAVPEGIKSEQWTRNLIRACHASFEEARALRGEEFDRTSLCRQALRLFTPDQHQDPFLLGAFRSFIDSHQTIERLSASIASDDPVRRICLGARPGRNWLQSLLDELHSLVGT